MELPHTVAPSQPQRLLSSHCTAALSRQESPQAQPLWHQNIASGCSRIARLRWDRLLVKTGLANPAERAPTSKIKTTLTQLHQPDSNSDTMQQVYGIPCCSSMLVRILSLVP